MLHLHNGDSTANTLKEANFPGHHFAFREALATGPTRQTHTPDEWFTMRAAHLAASNQLDAEQVCGDLRRQDEALRDVGGHDEVILWFEHDLFCQINLIYLLDRFAREGTGQARLSLICIGEYPGIKDFRGLGQLTAEQMAGLFDTRHEVTDAELQLAQQAWAAYCAADPRVLETLLADDTLALPFLRGAILQHLARFPSMRNGLGHAENRLLELIAQGGTTFHALCPAFFNAEPAYGLGDSQVWNDLQRMAEAKHPLLTITAIEGADSARSFSAIRKTSFALTETGKDILKAEADFIALNGIDQWLGGVHLNDEETVWRWNESSQRLESPAVGKR